MLRRLLLLALLCTGCADDIKGRLAAQNTGDIIETPLTRVDPTAPMLEACGVPLEDDSSILRRPYVQQVEPESAHVLWVSDRDTAETLVVSRTVDEEQRTDGAVRRRGCAEGRVGDRGDLDEQSGALADDHARDRPGAVGHPRRRHLVVVAQERPGGVVDHIERVKPAALAALVVERSDDACGPVTDAEDLDVQRLELPGPKRLDVDHGRSIEEIIASTSDL